MYTSFLQKKKLFYNLQKSPKNIIVFCSLFSLTFPIFRFPLDSNLYSETLKGFLENRQEIQI